MLSILIVNCNTRDYLRACLLSLETACSGVEHEIIVVDNASQDGSAEMVSTLFPRVQLIASSENLGYAAGNNLACEHSCGQWVWLLNPDTEVLRDAPKQLISFLEGGTRRGAVASALIDARTARPQKSCRTFPTPAALWAEASGLAKFYPRSRKFGFYRMGWWRYHDARRVEQPMASSLLLRRAAIEGVYDQKIGGLFDEDFPIFFNDVDLCWRLWKSGWEIWYQPDAGVLHHGGASTQQVKPAMIAESHRCLRRFYEKHYRAVLSPPVYWATIALIEAGGAWRLRGSGLKSGVKYSD
jgi:GT2 family glycosyltransferase